LFLKRGYQISRDALPTILKDPEKTIQGLTKLKPRPFIITKEHVKKALELSKKPKVEIKILKKYETKKKQIRIEDYVEHFQTRYQQIKNLLLNRMDKEKLTSINKITPHVLTPSIIGVVRKKTKENLLLEDPSGEILLSFNAKIKPKIDEIDLDDVIGVDCKGREKTPFVKKIYFPEISSSRDIVNAQKEIKIAFLFSPSSLNEKQQKKFHKTLSTIKPPPTIFLFTNNSNKDTIFSNLSPIKLQKNSPPTLFQIDKIGVLVLQKNFFGAPAIKDPVNFIISVLRRRHLITKFNPKIHVGANGFVLESPPDIIVSDFEGSFHKNYKGTTIILNSDPAKFFVVNLKTREVFEKSIGN